MKRTTLVLCCAISAIVTAAYFLRPATSQSSDAEASTAPQAIPVAVQELRKESVSLYQILPGRTSASESAEIRPQVTGIITARLFDEGSYVKQGQQLYQIDPAPYEAEHQSALADLQKAKANITSTKSKKLRYEELVKIDAVSRQDYDDITADYTQALADRAIAEARVAAAKINLDYTRVYAPIAGKIGKSLVTKGALVTANQPQHLATITRLDPIFVDVVQPAHELNRFRANIERGDKLPVELLLEGRHEPYSHKGELQFAEVLVDETTGSVQLRVLFPNPDGVLLPGMFVRAKLPQDPVEGILVPQRAAVRAPDGSLQVWIVQPDDTVSQRTVAALEAVDENWLVSGGVQPGERVVVEGIQKLRDGSLVAPVPAGGKKEAAQEING